MTRIPHIDAATAPASVKPLLDGVEASLGVVPNLVAGLAHSRASLKGYLELNKALAGGSLGRQLREQIALAVAEANGCDYCLAAHAYLGKDAGLDDEEIVAARRGAASEPKAAAAVSLAVALVYGHGRVSDSEIERVRDVGFTDREIIEITTEVALNVLTNYFNLLAGTEIDFPRVEPLERAA